MVKIQNMCKTAVFKNRQMPSKHVHTTLNSVKYTRYWIKKEILKRKRIQRKEVIGSPPWKSCRRFLHCHFHFAISRDLFSNKIEKSSTNVRKPVNLPTLLKHDCSSISCCIIFSNQFSWGHFLVNHHKNLHPGSQDGDRPFKGCIKEKTHLKRCSQVIPREGCVESIKKWVKCWISEQRTVTWCTSTVCSFTFTSDDSSRKISGFQSQLLWDQFTSSSFTSEKRGAA